jgi:hypothetical protein
VTQKIMVILERYILHSMCYQYIDRYIGFIEVGIFIEMFKRTLKAVYHNATAEGAYVWERMSP